MDGQDFRAGCGREGVRGGRVGGGQEVHVVLFMPFVQLIHEILAENGHEGGAEAENRARG